MTVRRIRQLQLARELADVVWTAYGEAAAVGVDLDIALEIIGRANIAKFPDCPNPRCTDGAVDHHQGAMCPDCKGSGKGQPIRREPDGKVLKPIDWIEPDMSEAVRS